MNEEILTKDNINLIYYVLKKLNLYCKMDDYYDIGLIALVKAAKNFDSNRGYNFSTFAIKVIKNSLLHEIRKEKAIKRKGKVISLNTPVLYNDRISPLENFIKSDINIEDDLIEKEKKELLYKSISKLSKREQLVLNHLYGLNDHEKLKQRELGEKIGISQAQISRIKNDSIRKIREMVGV